mgnify:FL=1
MLFRSPHHASFFAFAHANSFGTLRWDLLTRAQVCLGARASTRSFKLGAATASVRRASFSFTLVARLASPSPRYCMPSSSRSPPLSNTCSASEFPSKRRGDSCLKLRNRPPGGGMHALLLSTRLRLCPFPSFVSFNRNSAPSAWSWTSRCSTLRRRHQLRRSGGSEVSSSLATRLASLLAYSTSTQWCRPRRFLPFSLAYLLRPPLIPLFTPRISILTPSGRGD